MNEKVYTLDKNMLYVNENGHFMDVKNAQAVSGSDNSVIAAELTKLRFLAGLPSIRNIAKSVGCSPTTVSKILTPGNKVSSWEITRLVIIHLNGDEEKLRQIWISAKKAPIQIDKTVDPSTITKVQSDLRTPIFSVFVSLFSIIVFLIVNLQGFNFFDKKIIQSFSEYFQLFMGLLSIFTYLLTHLKRPSNGFSLQRKILFVTITFWSFGQLLWTAETLLLKRSFPFPSLADLGFIPVPLLLVVFFLSFMRYYQISLALRLMLVINAFCLSILFWEFIWSTLFSTHFSESQVLKNSIEMYYSFMNFLAVFLGASITILVRDFRNTLLSLTFSACILLSISNLSFELANYTNKIFLPLTVNLGYVAFPTLLLLAFLFHIEDKEITFLGNNHKFFVIINIITAILLFIMLYTGEIIPYSRELIILCIAFTYIVQCKFFSKIKKKVSLVLCGSD